MEDMFLKLKRSEKTANSKQHILILGRSMSRKQNSNQEKKEDLHEKEQHER